VAKEDVVPIEKYTSNTCPGDKNGGEVVFYLKKNKEKDEGEISFSCSKTESIMFPVDKIKEISENQNSAFKLCENCYILNSKKKELILFALSGKPLYLLSDEESA
jgi:hypothetical protein